MVAYLRPWQRAGSGGQESFLLEATAPTCGEKAVNPEEAMDKIINRHQRVHSVSDRVRGNDNISIAKTLTVSPVEPQRFSSASDLQKGRETHGQVCVRVPAHVCVCVCVSTYRRL